MKLKKLLSGVIAGAVAISTIAVSALTVGAAGTDISMLAESKDFAAWNGPWLQAEAADLATVADLTETIIEIKISTSGEYDADKNVAFKVYGWNGDNDNMVMFDGVEGKEDYTFYFDFNALEVPIELDEWGNLGLNSQAGHLPITLVSVKLIDKSAAVTEPEVTEPEITEPGDEVKYTVGLEAEYDETHAGTPTKLDEDGVTVIPDTWASLAGYNTDFVETDGKISGTFKIDFEKEVKFSGNYVALQTNVPYIEDAVATLKSVKLDGVDVTVNGTFLSQEGFEIEAGVKGLRLTLTNDWNYDIETQPVDKTTWATAFNVIEVEFEVEIPAVIVDTTPESTPESTPDTTPESTPDTTPDTTPVPGTSNGGKDDNKNPATGVALIALPVILAAAGMTGAGVILKKRK